jgi:hypothetical protein
MSRWTIVFAGLAVVAFNLPAIAADDLALNIEMKPGFEPVRKATGQTAQETGSGTTTRQIIVQETSPSPADASERKPLAAPAPGKAENAPPPAAAPAAPEAPKEPPDKAAVTAPLAPAGPGLKPEEVVIAVQAELKRVGCYPGAVDGVWGGRSREALAAFGEFAKVDAGNLAPTPEILALIKGKVEVVCVEAGSPQHHDGYGGGGPYGGGY